MSHDPQQYAAPPLIQHGPIAPAPAHRGRREPRFGFRRPTDGSRAPFRVLVSLRWLLAGVLGACAWLAGVAATPRRWRPAILGGPLLVASAGLASALLGARRLHFERVTIPVPDLPPALDGFRVVQITDMHLGWPFAATHTREAVRWARDRQPHIIVLTGDFVAADLDIGLLRDALQGITARQGVFATLGNHDYWTDTSAIERVLAEHGVVLLRNEARRIEVNGAAVRIVGVDCVWEDRHDLDRALNDHCDATPLIVLAHEPDVADEVAPRGAVLQLSGHTHAGHFSLPWFGPAFLPRHGLRYYRGLQRVGNMWLYVSRGIGGYPLRIGAAPEVTELTLRRC